jgi:hypothetical protein
MRLKVLVSIALATLAGCNTGKDAQLSPEPKSSSTATTTPTPAPAPEGALRLGAAIETSAEKVALSDVAKNPTSFVGKKFATTGTVTAVCQHMGCWMELKDDAGEAHIKMAGHAFFVPKTASGRKAKVLATLVQNPEDGACAEANHDKVAAAGGPAGAAAKGAAPGAAPKKGCKAEAEAQLGRPLAKLELLAEGVELM